MVAAASVLQGISIVLGSLVGASVLGAVFVGGIVAWREKAGAFYKAVAEEKTAEAKRLHEENERLRRLTDITPIVKTLERVIAALDRHSEMTSQVFEKVADMNGSLRAHGEAMKALADHLILDEAARALLATAASDKPDQDTRRRQP